MSILILNRGGVGGGLVPELTVISEAGSTVDLLRGGVIVDTYTYGSAETSHTFIVKLGVYTVNGTSGSTTTSQDVLIDLVTQYSIELNYTQPLWLYYNGNEYTSVTGGFVGRPMTIASNGFGAKSPTITKNSTSVTVKVSTGGSAYTTKNLIDVSPYSSLVFSGSANDNNNGNYNSYWKQVIVLSSSASYWRGQPYSRDVPQGSSTDLVFDISDLSGSYYIGLGFYSGPSTTTMTMTKLVLMA